jgi:hypothetical protein
MKPAHLDVVGSTYIWVVYNKTSGGPDVFMSPKKPVFVSRIIVYMRGDELQSTTTPTSLEFVPRIEYFGDARVTPLDVTTFTDSRITFMMGSWLKTQLTQIYLPQMAVIPANTKITVRCPAPARRFYTIFIGFKEPELMGV